MNYFLKGNSKKRGIKCTFCFKHLIKFVQVKDYYRCICACLVASVLSDSLQPYRLCPARLLYPQDFPGKNTGVGCHFLLHCMKVKSESEVAQSCPTLRDPMDCSPPGFSAQGIFQARVLEWGAIAFSIYVPRSP